MKRFGRDVDVTEMEKGIVLCSAHQLFVNLISMFSFLSLEKGRRKEDEDIFVPY